MTPLWLTASTVLYRVTFALALAFWAAVVILAVREPRHPADPHEQHTNSYRELGG
jgi:hypothetical protein